MDIYWIQDKEKKGPLPEVEVLSLLESGLIPETVKAWHAGCEEWMLIRELPALKDFLFFTDKQVREEQESEASGSQEIPTNESDPDLEHEDATEEETAEAVLVIPYPYVRFLARMADALMHLTFYLALLRMFGMGFNPDLLPGSYEALLYICLPMILIESCWLSTLGTTPGKALLGVSVRDYMGMKLRPGQAFRRSLFVMVLGMGCFVPGLIMIALFFSWWWVRRFGFTPWDRRMGTTDVLNEPLSFRKLALVLVLIVLCLPMIYFLILPWIPDLEAYMEASSKM